METASVCSMYLSGVVLAAVLENGVLEGLLRFCIGNVNGRPWKRSFSISMAFFSFRFSSTLITSSLPQYDCVCRKLHQHNLVTIDPFFVL